jgi:hypothetical protein
MDGTGKGKAGYDKIRLCGTDRVRQHCPMPHSVPLRYDNQLSYLINLTEYILLFTLVSLSPSTSPLPSPNEYCASTFCVVPSPAMLQLPAGLGRAAPALEAFGVKLWDEASSLKCCQL